MEVSWQNRLNARGLHLISRWVHHTCRIDVEGMEHVTALREADKPVLWTSWHGQTMMLIGFLLQKLENVDVQVMIPDDWRGEALYHWHNQVDGVTPHPMDLENKGMDTARRFLNLVKTIKKTKRDNFIAPDGPAGPAFEVKPGALFIAQKARTPLLPIAAYARHSYIVPRWDGYVIPYPFSRIQVVIQPPFEVPPKADLASLNDKLRHTLNETWVLAQTRYYVPAGSGPDH